MEKIPSNSKTPKKKIIIRNSSILYGFISVYLQEIIFKRLFSVFFIVHKKSYYAYLL